MKLLFENWNVFLNEGKRKELWQAMVDASPDGKWWKLSPTHPTREAYRNWLASLRRGDAFHGAIRPPQEDDDWGCAPGTKEDAAGNCLAPQDSREDLAREGKGEDYAKATAEWTLQEFQAGLGCAELWWTSSTGERMADPRTGRYITRDCDASDMIKPKIS